MERHFLKFGIFLHLTACSLAASVKTSTTSFKGNINGESINEQCGNKPFDIVFMLDGSDRVSTDEFSKQLQLASALVDSMDQNKTRLGVVNYGKNVNDVININDMENKKKIKTTLGNLGKIGGEPRLGDALYYLRYVALNDHESEVGVRRITILFSSGIPNDRTHIVNEARAALEQGITIIVVGIGKQVVEEDFHGIASSPSQSFTLIYRGGNETKKIMDELGCMICRGVSESDTDVNEEAVLHRGAKCHIRTAIDVTVGFDAPGIGVSNSKLILKFLVSLVDRLQHKSTEFSLNTVTTNCYGPEFDNITLGLESNMMETVSSVLGYGGCKGTLTLLQKIRQRIKAVHGKKRNVVILFLSSKMSNQELKIAKMEVRKLASAGVEIVVIVTGGRINEVQGRQLVSDSPHLFFTPNFEDLIDIEGRLLLLLCKIQGKSDLSKINTEFDLTTKDAFEQNLHDLSM